SSFAARSASALTLARSAFHPARSCLKFSIASGPPSLLVSANLSISSSLYSVGAGVLTGGSRGLAGASGSFGGGGVLDSLVSWAAPSPGASGASLAASASFQKSAKSLLSESIVALSACVSTVTVSGTSVEIGGLSSAIGS